MISLTDKIIRTGLLATVVALAATTVGLYFHVSSLNVELADKEAALQKERADFAVARENAAEQFAAATDEYRKKERALQTAASNARKERDEKASNTRAIADSLRDRMRDDAQAGASAGAGATSATAATGSFAPGSFGALLRGDAPAHAGKLIAEAERAEKIRAELILCYRMYNEAEKQLATSRP